MPWLVPVTAGFLIKVALNSGQGFGAGLVSSSRLVAEKLLQARHNVTASYRISLERLDLHQQRLDASRMKLGDAPAGSSRNRTIPPSA
jgi:hypothetical protein